MSGNDPKNSGKTDWSMTDSVLNTGGAAKPDPESPAQARVERGELITNNEADVPQAPSVDAPDPNAAQGILAKFKKNQLSRRATIQALETHYETQLDTLKYSLAKASQVQKARADVLAEEYLQQLDARQLEVLSELGLRNKDTRERALLDLTEMTVAKLREVQEKDWPDELRRDTIEELLGLRKRAVAEMMRELGGETEEGGEPA